MTTNDVLFYFLGFVTIYIVIYVSLGFFLSSSSPEEFQLSLSRAIDTVFAIIVLTICVTVFLTLPYGQQTIILSQTAQVEIVGFLKNPWSLLTTGFFIFLLYLIIYLFRIPMTPFTKPFTIMLLENGSWTVMAILALENLVKIFFNIDLVDSFFTYLNDVFGFVFPTATSTINSNMAMADSPRPAPTLAETVSTDSSGNTVITTSASSVNKEVFNVGDNKFTYADAPAVCAALGADLATYDQIEDAYNNGADWCTYGWSADQMAFFPTQKDKWKRLQSNPQTADMCGRPGVNGGKMPDPNMTLGVNCYGVKPPMSETDAEAIETQQQQQQLFEQSTPLTPEQIAFNQKLQYWKKNAQQVMNVNRFNENKWSEF